MFIEGENVLPGEQPEGAITENSPASGEQQATHEDPASGAANTGAKPVPFHELPEAKEYLGRQEKKWERETSRRVSQATEKLRGEFDQKIRELQSTATNPSTNMSAEDRKGLLTLVKMIKSEPEALKELGLDGLGELQNSFKTNSQNQINEQFNSELSGIAKTYSEKYGYEAADVEQDILEYIQNDPLWGRMGMAKGVVTKAAKDFFSDKQQELSDRLANMKLVNENKGKAKVSSQKPVGGVNQELPAPRNMKEAFSQARAKIEREGVKI